MTLFLILVVLIIGANCENYQAASSLNKTIGHRLGQRGEHRPFRNAAIVCDAPECARIARDILLKGGAIGDAAIAGMACMGVMHPQSSGIGGGLVAVHYTPSTKTSTVLSSRERAPLSANASMFDKLPATASDMGGLAIAVPAEIKGFHEIYKKWGGRVPWAHLFQGAIQLADSGFRVDSHTAYALKYSEKEIAKDPGLKEVFINRATGKVWIEGDRIRNLALAQTLKTVADDGGESFYNPNSALGSKILQDLQKLGSIIEARDLSSFSVQWQETLKHYYDHGFTLHTCGPPSTGAALLFILRILNKHKYMLRPNDFRTSQLLVEAMKHTFGRQSNFGDPDDPTYKNKVAESVREFTQSEDYLRKVIDKIKFDSTNQTRRYYEDDGMKAGPDSGTAHFAIVTKNGDAMSVTTTIGKFFGAKVRSPQTGIIFNNKMNNFERNPKTRVRFPANTISGGKRPMSTASPSIHVDPRGIVKLVMGGAGGDRILTALASVILNKLFLQMTLFDSIAARRLHHSLTPMELFYEPNYNRFVLDGLKRIGHKTKEARPGSTVVGITRQEQDLWGCLDARKPGSVNGY